METRIIKVQKDQNLGHFAAGAAGAPSLEKWEVVSESSETTNQLREVASYLQKSDIPVAFPTETVYGLGADATRSAAVKGIYLAKGRPSDNPLIVHVSDLSMLRSLLRPEHQSTTNGTTPTGGAGAAAVSNGTAADDDPIPAIYRPLLARFWPGPLTILLRNPAGSSLAPEVTAGLPTFGARLPASPLARTLIALAGRPLAAPSANASTRPSPTAARHVAEDMAGRIELIVDGGQCGVGVESTVVDGLCEPPVVLRPGGVGIDELRMVPGWEGVRRAYRDESEEGGGEGDGAPRAPGMKYKHYSPKAEVVLYEAGCALGQGGQLWNDLKEASEDGRVIALIRTWRWQMLGGVGDFIHENTDKRFNLAGTIEGSPPDQDGSEPSYTIREGWLQRADGGVGAQIIDLDLGTNINDIARGLFSVLRDADSRGANVIFAEAVSQDGDNIGAAVNNRLRKAASTIRHRQS